jgi:hypothetical protein
VDLNTNWQLNDNGVCIQIWRGCGFVLGEFQKGSSSLSSKYERKRSAQWSREQANAVIENNYNPIDKIPR